MTLFSIALCMRTPYIIDMTESMGARIKRLRTVEGWSLRTLAKNVGVGHSYIDDIERGHRTPSPDVLARIAGVFGVTAEYLKGSL